MTKQRKVETITSTKRGFAAMWESGGGLTSGGSATIITGRNGEKRHSVYIRRGGHLACGDHALVTVHNGFHVVRASVLHGTHSSASIWRILSTTVKDIDGEKWEVKAEMELVNSFSNGEWDEVLDGKFDPALKAAFGKASTYHNRSAWYVDTSERGEVSEADKKRRAEEMKCQDAERKAKRQAKQTRLFNKKAECEAASKVTKEAGLGNRLEAVNVRLEALRRDNLVVLSNCYFKWGWSDQLYTEDAVASIEQQVTQMETEDVEKEHQRQVNEAFRPKFEVFSARMEAIGLEIHFGDKEVKLRDDYYGHPYSNEGVATFAEKLDQAERKVAEAKAEAEAGAAYQAKKTIAVAKGLPTDIHIWCRRRGRTNAGDGWVLGQNGQDRGNTSWYNPQPRYSDEGDKIWEQILEGEVILRWAKGSSASEHEFEVIHLPKEGLTEAQLERISEILESLEEEWEGVSGLASGILSPSVDDGWLHPETGESLTKGFQTFRQKREQGDKKMEEEAHMASSPFAILAQLKKG